MLMDLISQIDKILVKDRELLLEHEKIVLKDCKELIELCLETNDEATKRIHLLELTLKMTVFLNNGNDFSFNEKIRKTLQA